MHRSPFTSYSASFPGHLVWVCCPQGRLDEVIAISVEVEDQGFGLEDTGRGILAECYVKKGQWDEAKSAIERIRVEYRFYTLPYWDHVVDECIRRNKQAMALELLHRLVEEKKMIIEPTYSFQPGPLI